MRTSAASSDQTGDDLQHPTGGPLPAFGYTSIPSAAPTSDRGKGRFEATNLERGLLLSIGCILVIALANDVGVALRDARAHKAFSTSSLKTVRD